MSPSGRLLLSLARWLGGKQRAEWSDAMAAEAASLDGNDLGWASGCATSALRDRLWRERTFILAIVLLPLCAVLLEYALFFPLVWLSRALELPGWTWVGVSMLTPLPFAYVLGRLRPRLGAYLAAPICFFVFQLVPLVIFWLQFGKSPLTWFGDGSTVYMMTPLAGLSCGLLVWLVGAWLGSRRTRAA